MERRGRIPVATFRTQEGKTRSRSRVREPDYNQQDPETDLFTLIEDNIALKEENKALKLEIEENKKSHDDVISDNIKILDELNIFKQKQKSTEDQIKDLLAKNAKVSTERNALDKLHKMKIDIINNLTNDLELMQDKQRANVKNTANVLIGSNNLRSKLLELLPSLSTTNDMDSLIDVESTTSMSITNELVERLADEFLSLKNSMNAIELQLYEANEKIAELLENQHHLDEENETLRTENVNLTKVAKLLTENMKESVETSKKMETALIKLKQRNDELNIKLRDHTDGGRIDATPSPTTLKSNQEFEQIQNEVHNQNIDHGERIVEMKSLLDTAIEKTTNDELKTLQVKMEILEENLRQAVARAERAEKELEQLKSNNERKSLPPQPTLLPPPPPPPLPSTLLYKPYVTTALLSGHAMKTCGSNIENDAGNNVAGSFSDSIALHNLHKGNGDKIIDNVKQQVDSNAATGLDALVREFKSGRVTLRRNRRKTHTNDALQEMFQVLEISQKQNRESKICIDMNF